MQQILIIDTSLGGVALATARWHADSPPIVAKFICPQRRAAESVLAVETQRMLARTPLLTRIVVAIGPGSFTGIRIGIAFACGLAASPSQLLGISSLSAIAAWWATTRGTAVYVYHAITADSGVVAYAAQDGCEVKLSPVNLPAPLPHAGQAQVLVARPWPRLTAQWGVRATAISTDELLAYALQALVWQATRMVTVRAQEWPRPRYGKRPYGGKKS